MKTIPVGEHHTALVDDNMLEHLACHTWHPWNNGDHLTYAVTYIDREKVKMERLVTGDFTSYCIDHRDNNPLNNQRENLRPATREQNASNRVDRKVPASVNGFGVREKKGPNGVRYEAYVKLGGKSLKLGPFTDADSAQRAYDAMRFLLVGEFATLNQPENVQESIVALKDYMAQQRKEYIDKVVTMLGSKREAAKALGISEASIYRA